jgi:hypothetical protein
LDPETVATVYTVAKKYKNERVEKYCCSLVITNFAAVWNRTKQVPWNYDEILEIINHFDVEVTYLCALFIHEQNVVFGNNKLSLSIKGATSQQL